MRFSLLEPEESLKNSSGVGVLGWNKILYSRNSIKAAQIVYLIQPGLIVFNEVKLIFDNASLKRLQSAQLSWATVQHALTLLKWSMATGLILHMAMVKVVVTEMANYVNSRNRKLQICQALFWR